VHPKVKFVQVVVVLWVVVLGLPLGRETQLRSKLLVVQVQVTFLDWVMEALPLVVEALLVHLLVSEIMVALVISFANIVGAQETLMQVLEEYLEEMLVPEEVQLPTNVTARVKFLMEALEEFLVQLMLD